MSRQYRNRSIAGRTVAVTGGARGIGRAIAAELSARGAAVVIGDIDSETASDTASALGLAGAFRLDVTDPASFAAFLDRTRDTVGPLDVLINNAGVMPLGLFTSEPDEITRRILDVNVYGVMLGTKIVLPHMLARGRGHCVNIASLAGENPTPGMATYCASKQAVLNFTDSMRREYRGRGVHFSAVLPTFTRTEMIAGTRAPFGLLAEPEDVARAIADLIARPRRRVTVTRSAGWLAAANKLTPRPIGEFMTRRLGIDHIFLEDVDQTARRTYDERLRRTR
ncbi:SDR family oxidoreductase [Nocardia uniformis]|uniref:SDR family oxidoreductase n=1 Tax=Nocardia uniformis TaxID=53432 RepID=A0A849BNX1_9NOCA|nr:SDR family oxidoreductase [Nocardia uniformis]NNH68412.1 SDR family oxidoreductase [Nocardia uniformis]